MTALILHPVIRDALRRAGANGAYVAAVSQYLAPAIRDMPVVELAKRLEARTGKPWVIMPNDAWTSETMHLLEKPNHYLTYETKARIILNEMKSNPVFA